MPILFINDVPNYVPRDYQLPFFEAMEVQRKKRAILLYHRRAGKTLTLLNWAIGEMIAKPITIAHVFPTHVLAKEIVWNGLDNNGRKYIDYFPEEYIKDKNEQETSIEFKNGSRYVLLGSDKYNVKTGTPGNRGMNAHIIIMDEYAVQDPRAWDEVFEPIIIGNKGTAVFAYTPMGSNHGEKLYEGHKNDPKWFVQRLTIDDTKDEEGNPIVSTEEIMDMRKHGKLEATIQQEYYCSFNGGIGGAYYTKQIEQAKKDKRIGYSVPYDSHAVVHTAWDIGISDYTSIWFIQKIGKEFHIIDFYQNNGEPTAHYVKILKEKEYLYGTHYMPHDADATELTSGKSHKLICEELLLKPIEIVERTTNIQQDIEACRGIFNQLWFDKEKTNEFGMSALEAYKQKWNSKKLMFEDSPLHDWTSHAADAFRTFVMSDLTKNLSNISYTSPKMKGTWGNKK